MDDRKELGKRLKQAREFRRLQQNRVAEQLGVHNSTVAKWETGDRGVDNLVMVKLADLYQVNLRWLMTGEGKMVDPIIDPDLNLDISELSVEEIEFLNELKKEVAFQDFLKDPEEAKQDLIETVKMLMRGRKRT